VEHFFRIGQEREVHIHFRQHALDHAEVAEIRFEARNDIDLLVAADNLVFHEIEREITRDAFKHIVPAGDVAADKTRRVRERHWIFLRDKTLFLAVVDEGIEVIADYLGHTRRRSEEHTSELQSRE